VPDAAAWRTVAHRHPRRSFDVQVVSLTGATTLRLEFLSRAEVRFAGRLVPSAESPQTQWASLQSARSSRLGDVGAAVASADSASLTMPGAESLELDFTATPVTPGLVRDAFLLVTGKLLAGRGSPWARREGQASALPARFVLEQNRPNPFAGATWIRFALPVGETVRLEVFDLQGRRLRTLADRDFPAGYHSVEWDQRDDSGRAVRPGVYFYRIEAGPFRDRKKMAVLPG
jgi:hypothetical protein